MQIIKKYKLHRITQIKLFKIIWVNFFLFLTPHNLFAQDLHFSQFYAAPIYYNPAHTGLFNADYRVGGNYKNQYPWARVGNPTNFRTFSAYTDMVLLKGNLKNKNDKIGIGILVANDRAGDGNFTTSRIGINVAYHKSLDQNNKFMISLGASATYVHKNLDFDLLFFNNQWNDRFFDLNLPSGEGFQGTENINYFDVSTGLIFTYTPNRLMSFKIGSSIFHANRPNESFHGFSNKLGIRSNTTFTGTIYLSKNWHIEPGIMYGFQKKASEFLISSLIGYSLSNDALPIEHTLILGFSGRFNDALIPVVGYQYKTLRVMINYDVNTSSLTQASNSNGGIEISIVYMWNKPGSQHNSMIPCPRL